MKKELEIMLPNFYDFLEGILKTNVSVIAKMPKFLKSLIGSIGLKAFNIALDLTYEITKSYTP